MSNKDDLLYLTHIAENIEWRQIAAFRHRVVHDYLSGFDLELAWRFIEHDLPPLRSVIEAKLKGR